MSNKVAAFRQIFLQKIKEKNFLQADEFLEKANALGLARKPYLVNKIQLAFKAENYDSCIQYAKIYSQEGFDAKDDLAVIIAWAYLRQGNLNNAINLLYSLQDGVNNLNRWQRLFVEILYHLDDVEILSFTKRLIELDQIGDKLCYAIPMLTRVLPRDLLLTHNFLDHFYERWKGTEALEVNFRKIDIDPDWFLKGQARCREGLPKIAEWASDKKFQWWHDVIIHDVPNASQLAICFTGASDRMGFPLKNMVKHCEETAISGIFVKDFSRSFYLEGISSLGSDFTSSYAELNKLASSMSGGENIICIGSSAGCFPALKYAPYLHAKRVLCFGGTYSHAHRIDPETGEAIYPKGKWARLKAFYKDERTSIIEEVKTWKTPIDVELVYGADCEIDNKQARLMQDIKGIRLIELQGCNAHGAVRYLKAHNPQLLQKLIRKKIDPKDPSVQNVTII